MSDFLKRSDEKELLDNPSVPFEDIKQTMQELGTINTWLGGHRTTLEGLKKLLNNRTKVSVCEIGCGGGDNLVVIQKWCRRYGIEAELTGIDINPHAIAYAKSRYGILDIQFICDDYRANTLVKKPDIFFNSLFCHHFDEGDLVEMLRWMRVNSRCGFFINDLHRHPFAYYSIKWLTKLFSNSYLVKHDAALSVRRGFTKAEWMNLFEKAGLSGATIDWQWAFRYLIVCRNGGY
ncbi:methyltransferase domain-containing protein [Sphingobacterium sp. SGR-19]|uniref:methyltransferase domain-containing protein n=1 Tax=Sphingobacterium sp. SGR-19 TaxID=2710886 RepID=UPI0013EB9B69|nr:methyltransferase domain-containing protein [Sphingobacterium sp. SGR-19]NGM64881.1 methyltransferase domain-containing protein [Sphingobacterium sp. SGR-19]